MSHNNLINKYQNYVKLIKANKITIWNLCFSFVSEFIWFHRDLMYVDLEIISDGIAQNATESRLERASDNPRIEEREREVVNFFIQLICYLHRVSSFYLTVLLIKSIRRMSTNQEHNNNIIIINCLVTLSRCPTLQNVIQIRKCEPRQLNKLSSHSLFSKKILFI